MKAEGKVNAKCLNKRLYLVEFVILEQLEWESWARRSFKTRKRIDWTKTAASWNEAHPLDAMSPAVLKATYYRAIRQRDLQVKFFDKHMDAKLRELLKRYKPGGTLTGQAALDYIRLHVDPTFLRVVEKTSIVGDAGKTLTVIDAGKTSIVGDAE